MEAITYEQLLQQLKKLPREQRQQPVRFWGENRGGMVYAVDILTEDHINPSGDGAEPASLYRPQEGEEFEEGTHLSEEDIQAEICYPKDTILLRID